jgi:hypothetical protein
LYGGTSAQHGRKKNSFLLALMVIVGEHLQEVEHVLDILVSDGSAALDAVGHLLENVESAEDSLMLVH